VLRLKAVLVNPPTTVDFETQTTLGLKAPPLGLAYIAAVLEKAGITVTIIDGGVSNISHRTLGKKLNSLSPDVIGITSMTPTIHDAIKAVIIAKENCPDAVTIMGGCHITALPIETMAECPQIDIGVIGEGEETILDIFRKIIAGGSLAEVDGIAFREGSKVRLNRRRKLIENLDAIPFPARHLLPLNSYSLFGKRMPLGNIITSRGCPFQCIFCSSAQFYGRVFRARSPDNVVDEMELLHEKYGMKAIEIVDDSFTVNKVRAAKIALEIAKRRLDVVWGFGSRADTITKELLQTFKRAGCGMFYLGIESGSDRILKTLRKGITIEEIKRALSWAKKAGVETMGSFIIGVPGETRWDVLQTINFAKTCGVDFAQFTVMTPYPGTEVYEMAKREGLLVETDWSKYTTIRPVMKTNELTPQEISKLIHMAYKSFYIRGNFFLQQIKHKRINWLEPIIKHYFLKMKFS